MPLVASSHHHQYQHPSHNPDASYSMLFSPAASSLASTPGGGLGLGGGGGGGASTGGGVELEVNWDPSLVRGELLQASAILSHRGLKLASKWAAEQVMGIPVGHEASFGVGGPGGGHHQHQHQQQRHQLDTPEDPDDSFASTGAPAAVPLTTMMHEMTAMRERDWYAKSLLDLGEYLHAASVLSQDQQQQHSHGAPLGRGSSAGPGPAGGLDTKGAAAAAAAAADITQMGPPQQDLSTFGFYLRAYALYMAGERRKEEEYVEMERYGRAGRTIFWSLVCDHTTKGWVVGWLVTCFDVWYSRGEWTTF
jgi:hypothetical protein